MGRVVGGALIEKEVTSNFKNKESLLLTLNHQDFTTATRVAESINAAFSSAIARTSDSGSVEVQRSAQIYGQCGRLCHRHRGAGRDAGCGIEGGCQ